MARPKNKFKTSERCTKMGADDLLDTPMPIKVYLAGKIARNDWRHDIFPKLSRATENQEISFDVFRYEGPFFIAGGGYNNQKGAFHGPCTHGRGAGAEHETDDLHDYDSYDPGAVYYSDGEWSATHNGMNLGEDTTAEVVDKCINWITNSHIIFCWLDKPDAYGTLVELGLAKQMGKPIFLAMPIGFKTYKDMWFAWTLADMSIMIADHKQAWDLFCSVAQKLLKKSTQPHLIYQVDKNCLVTNAKAIK
jgi:nucleoside 2-deoxyribosyltransferase